MQKGLFREVKRAFLQGESTYLVFEGYLFPLINTENRKNRILTCGHKTAVLRGEGAIARVRKKSYLRRGYGIGTNQVKGR